MTGLSVPQVGGEQSSGRAQTLIGDTRCVRDRVAARGPGSGAIYGDTSGWHDGNTGLAIPVGKIDAGSGLGPTLICAQCWGG